MASFEKGVLAGVKDSAGQRGVCNDPEAGGAAGPGFVSDLASLKRNRNRLVTLLELKDAAGLAEDLRNTGCLG